MITKYLVDHYKYLVGNLAQIFAVIVDVFFQCCFRFSALILVPQSSVVFDIWVIYWCGWMLGTISLWQAPPPSDKANRAATTAIFHWSLFLMWKQAHSCLAWKNLESGFCLQKLQSQLEIYLAWPPNCSESESRTILYSPEGKQCDIGKWFF